MAKPSKRTPLEILSEYRKKTEQLKARGSEYKELRPLRIEDVLYIRAMLHPTDREDSKRLTRELIMFLCDQGICTAEDIYRELGFSENPVLRRLKFFREQGLVRREEKRYYIATDRLLELRRKYLERVCR